MGKVDDGGGKKRGEIMSFIVSTNVIASLPPERGPTGTPTARSENKDKNICPLMSLQVNRLIWD